MHRLTLSLVLACVCCLSAAAQQIVVPPPDQSAKKEIQGADKLRYICKQLNLTDEQKQHVRSLLVIYEDELKVDPEDMRERLERIRSLYVELREAQDAGDEERADQLRTEMRDLAPGLRAEKNFYEALEPALSEEQLKLLSEIRKRLEKNPDVALKPVHVCRIALDQKLDQAQRLKLDDVMRDFRREIADRGELDESTRDELLNKFIKAVRDVLTSKQVAAFDQEVNKLRPDAPL